MFFSGFSTARNMRLTMGALFALVLCTAPVMAAVNASKVNDGTDTYMELSLGKGEIITIPDGVSDVMIADPKVADVSAVQSNKLYLVGTNLGMTNIMILDQGGNLVKRFNVDVSINVVEIQRLINKIFPQEKDVQVQLVGKQVALTGLVSTPAASQKIARLVAAHVQEMSSNSGGATQQVNELIENLMEVRGEQQVMLRVRIVEMSRNVLKELGSEVSSLDPSAVVGRNGIRGQLDTTGTTGLTKSAFSIGSLLFNTGIGGIGDLNVTINMLEENNLANTLAEPNLTAISGEEAGFLAGGEFPVPTGRDNQGNIIISYKKFGVSLNFKPIVLSEDRISLQMNTEVSSLNQAQGITLADVQVPGLDVRRATTTVEMNSGGSLMIAGLLKSDNTKGLNGIPGIKDTPILGDLLSSKSFQRNETELVVIVTPYLVQPFADKTQATPVMGSNLNVMPPPAPPAGLMAPGKNGKPVMPAPVDESMLDDNAPAQAAPAAGSEADDVPPVETVKVNTPLNKVFSNNMKQIYGKKLGELPAENKNFGYMLD